MIEIPSGFSKVYSGSFHDVYCDGKVHKTVVGGGAGSARNGIPGSEVWRKEDYNCNCKKYADEVKL